jgi:hypothetical protein
MSLSPKSVNGGPRRLLTALTTPHRLGFQMVRTTFVRLLFPFRSHQLVLPISMSCRLRSGKIFFLRVRCICRLACLIRELSFSLVTRKQLRSWRVLRRALCRAERLRHDPAMRWIVGGKAAHGSAAAPSQIGRFETQWLAADKNLLALADLSGQWIDQVHARRPPRGIVLDMDSSVSPTHGDQENSVWNGHYSCTCYHPLFVFNQFGDLERCSLRPGNVHSLRREHRGICDPRSAVHDLPVRFILSAPPDRS